MTQFGGTELEKIAGCFSRLRESIRSVTAPLSMLMFSRTKVHESARKCKKVRVAMVNPNSHMAQEKVANLHIAHQLE